MPYTFYEGFGNAKVTNDLRTRGYFVGTAAVTRVAPALPYLENAVGMGSVSAATGSPGGVTADPFCAQLSGRTMGELWSGGGCALYWRGQLWVGNSVVRMPVWDGAQWNMVTSNQAPGSYIGLSPNNCGYTFSQVSGSQNQAAYTTTIAKSNPVWDSTRNEIMWADTVGATTVIRYGNSTSGFAAATLINAAYAIWGMYSNGGRTVVYGAGGGFGFARYSDNGGAGPWVNIPVTGNNGFADAVRNPINPDGWVLLREGGGGASISTDNLATAPFVALSVAPRACAASATSVVLVGNASSVARCTTGTMDLADWTYSTLPIASETAIGLAYGNGRYVATTANNIFISTDDGLTWTSQTIASSVGTFGFAGGLLTGKTSLTFQNGLFVIASMGSSAYCMAESTDGVTWTVRVFGYAGGVGGTSAVNLQSCTGMFTSSTSGTITVNAVNAMGFTANASTQTATSAFVPVVGSTARTATPALLGVNQWHEFQMVMRPTTTVNQWTVTPVIDDVAYTSYTYALAASGDPGLFYPWFNMARTGVFANVGPIIFYEFDGATDTTVQVGPDLRVYAEVPVSDDTTEWNPSDAELSNAENVATRTVTGTTTYVSESGANKIDQYELSQNSPMGVRVLSLKTEAYFSRMLSNPAFVQVGAEYSGIATDSVPVQAIAPVGSFNYVSQQLDQNPVTGLPWTQAQVNGTRLRIRRATDAPVTTMLAHCDGAQGATTMDLATMIGNGGNSGTGGAILTTADSRFGGSCIQIPAGGRWNFYGAFGGPGNGLGLYDFTIECWVKTNTGGNAAVWSMDAREGGGVFGGLLLAPSGLFLSNANNNWDFLANPSGTITGNVWRHLAVCRQGGTFYYWIEGVAATGSPRANSGPVGATPGSSGVLSFAASAAFAGFIDEIRVSRGCRYTTPFTPPNAPFTS